MKIVKFDARKIICDDLLRYNDKIESIYLEIAEMVLVKLYKAFPFHSLFEGFKCNDDPNEFFKGVVLDWADFFMECKINDMGQAIDTVKTLIFMDIIPTLGVFASTYRGDNPFIENRILRDYVSYTLNFMNVRDALIYGAKFYGNWLDDKNGIIKSK